MVDISSSKGELFSDVDFRSVEGPCGTRIYVLRVVDLYESSILYNLHHILVPLFLVRNAIAKADSFQTMH